MQKDQSRSSLSNTLQNKRKRSGSQDETNDYAPNSSLHDDEKKPFRCNFCPKRYQVEKSLKRHKNDHTHEKKYQCSQCAMYFFRTNQLKEHIETQHEEKTFGLEPEFICALCSKKYTYKKNLIRHQNIHTHEKKYQCSQCSMYFFCSDQLKEHIKSQHEKTPFVCNLCFKEYISEQNLIRHKNETSHRHECCYCLNLFPNLLDLQNHIELCKTHRNPLKVARVSVIQLSTKSQA